jgi:tripartite-type tricarboxylate transporter receptor subunit TctC
MRIASLMFALAALALGGQASAQQYPSKPVTIVVPVGPGGPTDLLARALADRLQQRLGQPFVVENQAGANSYIGGRRVAQAAPDGYTLLVNAIGGLYGYLFVKEQVPLSQELAGVASMGYAPSIFLIPGSIEAKDLRQFVSLVRANPGKMNTITMPNTALYLELLAFLKANGMEMTEVPTSGAANAVAALLRNDVHMYLGGTVGALQFIESGKLRVLAVASPARYAVLANVATAKEQGFDFESGTEYLAFVPVKTPAGVVRLLNEAITASTEDAAYQAVMTKIGFTLSKGSAEEMARRMANQTRLLERTAKENRLVPQ